MEYRDNIIKRLIEAKITSPRLETDIILKYASPNYPMINDEEKEKIEKLVQRRCSHEPLDKIIGKKEFYKSTFKVSTDVLSPRPDTEILVEAALDLIPINKPYKILDLGVGSGCILLSILKDRTQTQGVGVDISIKAIDIAKENAQTLGVENAVEFINADWNTLAFDYSEFDIIVSNPPYIPQKELGELDIEVKNYDPLIALDGGNDGLKCYYELAKKIPYWLKKEGYVLLEVGYNQAKTVAQIFEKEGLKTIKIIPDLAGINRCVVLKK